MADKEQNKVCVYFVDGLKNSKDSIIKALNNLSYTAHTICDLKQLDAECKVVLLVYANLYGSSSRFDTYFPIDKILPIIVKNKKTEFFLLGTTISSYLLPSAEELGEGKNYRIITQITHCYDISVLAERLKTELSPVFSK